MKSDQKIFAVLVSDGEGFEIHAVCLSMQRAEEIVTTNLIPDVMTKKTEIQKEIHDDGDVVWSQSDGWNVICVRVFDADKYYSAQDIYN